MKLAIKLIITLIILFFLVILYKEISSGFTRPIRDARGNVIPESAALLKKVELGGME